MKEIDFLPRRYHEQIERRHARWWLASVLLLFAGLIGATAFGQYLVHRSLWKQCQLVEARHAVAVTHEAELQQLQQEAAAARQQALLYTYLQHPWPRTQLLAELVNPLPETVLLTKLTVTRRATAVQAPPLDSATTTAPSAASDLALLRQEDDASPTTIELSGVTPEPAHLHAYVSTLNQSSLLKSVKLESLETQPEEMGGGAEFLIQLSVVPGYGQTSGPAGPPDGATTLAQQESPP